MVSSRHTCCELLLLTLFLLGYSWITVVASVHANAINGFASRNLEDTGVVIPQILHRSIGEKELLVVRIDSNNGRSTTASTEKLKQNIFNDEITVTTQFASCSRQQFLLKPAGGSPNIDNGVITVKLDSVEGRTARDIYQEIAELSNDTDLNYFGRKLEDFDQIMLCMPRGVSPPQNDEEKKGNDWIAFVPRQLKESVSIYNDEWCSSVSSAMHEIGHTLGLQHSGENSNSYDDLSGQMGVSYKGKVGARRCFNPAKSWQLGWYSNESRRLDPMLDKMPFSIVLKGVADEIDSNDVQQHSLLKIYTGPDFDSEGDIYVGYNHRNGFNSETMEGDNMVLINQQNTENRSSKLLAKLDTNDSFRFENFRGIAGKTLVIQMKDRLPNARGALVSVFFEIDNDEPTEDGCSEKLNQVRFDINIVTDFYPEETFWTLENDLTGEIVASRAKFSYFDPSTNYNDWICLDRDGASYTFSLFDAFQDGLCCENGFGSYSAFLDGIEVFRGGEFVGMRSVQHSFPVPNSTIGETNDKHTDIPSGIPTESFTDIAPAAPTSSPTEIPTNKPTALPTGSPTGVPTNTPTDKPTRRANRIRTELEKLLSNRGDCENDSSYLFNNKIKRDCDWIARNESRRKQKCARNDPKTTFSVKFHCPGVCIDECLENNPNNRRSYKNRLRKRR